METRLPANPMLVAASAALAGAVLLHGIDHSLPERGVGALSTEVLVGSIVNAALAAFVLVLAVRGHPRAPPRGGSHRRLPRRVVLAAHFAPQWSAFSDSDLELDLGFVSWVLRFEVLLGGFMIAAVALFSLTVALRRDRRASLIALLAGPWIAAAIIVGHFIPYWGEFSDPYKDAGLEPISSVLAAAAVAAGLALAGVALAAALSPASPRNPART